MLHSSKWLVSEVDIWVSYFGLIRLLCEKCYSHISSEIGYDFSSEMGLFHIWNVKRRKLNVFEM